MGAAPSGWVAPPYFPAPVSFAAVAAVSEANPALGPYPGPDTAAFETAGVSPCSRETFLTLVGGTLPSGTKVMGIAANPLQPMTVFCQGPACPGGIIMQVQLVLSAFNIGTITWNNTRALVYQTVAEMNWTQTAGGGYGSPVAVLNSGIMTVAPVTAVNIIQGVRIRATNYLPGWNGGFFLTNQEPVPALCGNPLAGNWKLMLSS